MSERKSLFQFRRANADKPHRCPTCHGLVAYPKARWWRLYRCPKDGTRWWSVIAG